MATVNSRKIFPLIIALVLVAIAIYSFTGSPSDTEEYREKIEELRANKNRELKQDAASPLPLEEKASFTGLSYYPIDEQYRIKASFEKFRTPPVHTLQTSDGKARKYLEWGKATFNWQGNEHELSVLKPAEKQGSDYFFIPFFDHTSAMETYGGGRYIDVEPPSKQHILIDFNTAYNPYCAYSNRYSCPIPPLENKLSMAVEAGEKAYEKRH
jgi:uncharacterized protein (DUF1684 family)